MSHVVRRHVVLLAIVALAATACRKNELRMVYDKEFGVLVPLVSAGTTIEWMGLPNESIKWGGGESPCDSSSSDRCRIASGLDGMRFKYKCAPPTPCDPEIAIDGGVIITTQNQPADGVGAPYDYAIEAYCGSGAVTLDNTNPQLIAGRTVSWKPSGKNPPLDWTVEFERPADACANANPTKYCKMKVGEWRYKFTSTTETCKDQVANGTLTVVALTP
jgi:hypothetical protein